MLYFRKDVDIWTLITVGQLREILNSAEIPDSFELMPNGVGNIAICEGDGRQYIGFIDMATGEVHMRRGARHDDGLPTPGRPDQVPWNDPGPTYVDDGQSLEANRP